MEIGRGLFGIGRALVDARTTYRRYGAVTEAGVRAAVTKEIAHVTVLRGAAQKLFGTLVPEKTHPDLAFPIRVQGASLCIPVKTDGGLALIQFAHTDFNLSADLRGITVLGKLPTIVVFRRSDMRHLDSLSLSQQRQLLEDPIGYIAAHAVFIITPSTVFGRTEYRPTLQLPDVDPRTFHFDDFTSTRFQQNIARHVQPRTLLEIEELLRG